jgi:Fe-S oxidoreductase
MGVTPDGALAARLRAVRGENAYLCYQCQRCSSGCPNAGAMPIPPARMMRMAQVGLVDRLATDPSIWRCLGCDSCTQHCPHGVSVRQLVEMLRQETMQERWLAGHREAYTADPALEKGLGALGALGGRVTSFHNVSGEDNASRLAWTSNLAVKPEGIDRSVGADTVYFVGCVSAMFPMSYGIPQAFAGLLAKAGESWTTMGGEEWCCGFPLMMAGQLAQARELMEHNVGEVRRLGAKRVVMTCPSCHYTWKHVYPETLGADLGFDVVTSSEMMRDFVADDRLAFGEAKRPGVVAFHDPCDLGRKGGHYDEPREVLAALPGFRLVEMENNREHALCCGGGGDLETFEPALVAAVSHRRVDQAVAAGADHLVSACPQCVRTLAKAVKARQLRIRVMDLVQLLDAATTAGGRP